MGDPPLAGHPPFAVFPFLVFRVFLLFDMVRLVSAGQVWPEPPANLQVTSAWLASFSAWLEALVPACKKNKAPSAVVFQTHETVATIKHSLRTEWADEGGDHFGLVDIVGAFEGHWGWRDQWKHWHERGIATCPAVPRLSVVRENPTFRTPEAKMSLKNGPNQGTELPTNYEDRSPPNLL